MELEGKMKFYLTIDEVRQKFQTTAIPYLQKEVDLRIILSTDIQLLEGLLTKLGQVFHTVTTQ